MGQTGLAALTQPQLNTWMLQAKTQVWMGHLPDYIPLLAKSDSSWIGVQVRQLNGQIQTAGDEHQPFALMSVIKPFMLLFLLERLGSHQVFTHVGMDPSDQPFHSLAQLQADLGFPRNPMINSGAIALAALLPGVDGFSRCEALRQWLNQQSGSQLVLNQPMLASVRALRNEANRAIAELLASGGNMESVEVTLDTYNHICCLTGTVEDLAQMGNLLAGSPAQLAKLDPRNLQTVNALMLTCGLYESSGRYAVQIGLPMKSGVSGALLAVVPGQGAIACFSPTLDDAGNSIAGLFILEQMAKSLNLSIFR